MVRQGNREVKPLRHISNAVLAALLLTALPACQDSIHDLARFGHVDGVKALLDAHPDLIRAKTRDLYKTPLHEAAAAPNGDVVKLLLERGADIQAKDRSGLSPLHVTAILGTQAAALELLNHGADIEARDNFGDTPLHLAAIFDKRDMMKFLVEHGAKLEAKNDKGFTPLQVARSIRKDDAVKALIALGASDSQ